MGNKTVKKPLIKNRPESSTGFNLLDQSGRSIGTFNLLSETIKQIKNDRAASTLSSQMPQLIGMVLHSSKQPISQSDFVKMHPVGSSFYNEVVTQGNDSPEEKTDGAIVSCYCYVPELSGFYPFPDPTVLRKYQKNLKSIADQTDSKNDAAAKALTQAQAMAPQVFSEYSKIVHHPVFHKFITGGDSAPAMFEYVRLKSAASLPSLYEGVLIAGTNKIWDPEG